MLERCWLYPEDVLQAETETRWSKMNKRVEEVGPAVTILARLPLEEKKRKKYIYIFEKTGEIYRDKRG